MEAAFSRYPIRKSSTTFRRLSRAQARGSEFADMIVDAFEVMHEECTRRPLVMGIALHAYVVGWPHRFKHLARAMRHIASHADASACGLRPRGTSPILPSSFRRVPYPEHARHPAPR